MYSDSQFCSCMYFYEVHYLIVNIIVLWGFLSIDTLPAFIFSSCLVYSIFNMKSKIQNLSKLILIDPYE